MLKGRIHSYETFGAADGPGVRFVVFLHGCRFRCRYCHNPDTWAGPAPMEATPGEVLERALRYRSYWREEGGITVSGGEPMLQPAFVAELFRQAHAAGATTCLDTAAGGFDRNCAEVVAMLAETDTVLLDVKLLDAAAHRALTGADNAPVVECARYLAELGKATWIRRVLVPGVTDDERDLRETGRFIRTLPNVVRVDVLPYHAMGAAKWRALGLDYSLAGVRAPTAAELDRARALLGCVPCPAPAAGRGR
ncbi:MAG: pyruvate formate-lyase-activating protein [Kiritimatiellia bacterium]